MQENYPVLGLQFEFRVVSVTNRWRMWDREGSFGTGAANASLPLRPEINTAVTDQVLMPPAVRRTMMCAAAITLTAAPFTLNALSPARVASSAVSSAAPSASTRASFQRDGFIGVRVDADRNKLLLEIPADRLNSDFLHQSTLATGLGGLGLDRGQLGSSVVVHLERHGKRILMVRDNWSVRAPGAKPAEQRAASEAFATSVIATFPIESDANGVIVADATSFFLADTYGIAESIRRGQQGNARIDATRSWVDSSRTKAFPKNTEIHSVLTFAVDNPGATLRRGAPDASAVTMEVHHSLVALPDSAGFRARQGDGRSGVSGPQFYDFSQSYDGTYRNAIANRWRLTPKDAAAYGRGELSDPVTPIVYYLDPGIPAEYREALREGGMWWNKTFEAAGFKNAFFVRDLPAGADAMDARYNMMYWIHRAGPGPSVGPSFSDPRTGEIVRTVVRMDAWRSLIDYNIYAGLLPAAGPNGLSVSPEQFAMARRRQHAAHEIGHTLGFPHNYIASAQGRTSVMDYPFPLISLNAKNELDLTKAYAPAGGAWDTLTVRYGYTWFATTAEEKTGLDKIVKDGLSRNVRFIADQHSGAEGSIPTQRAGRKARPRSTPSIVHQRCAVCSSTSSMSARSSLVSPCICSTCDSRMCICIIAIRWRAW